MEKEKMEEAVKLTLAVYHLTGKFPENEILKKKIREVSLDLLENFISDRQNDIINRVRLLGILFILAQKQNWTENSEFQSIFEKYKEFIDLAKIAGRRDNSPENNVKKNSGARLTPETAERLRKEKSYLRGRQEAIIDILRESKSGIMFRDLVKSLETKKIDDVSPRTIRNELKRLVDKRIVEQNGWARRSMYKLIK